MHQFFFWLLIILLPIQLGYHTWPSWAMVLGRQVDYLSPTLFLTDVLIVLILIFWLRKISLIPLLLVGIVAGVNILFSWDKMVSLYHWIKLVEFGLLGWYVIKTKPSHSQIAHYLSIAVLYSSCIAIVQFMLQHSVGVPLWFLGERTFSVDTPGIARVVLGGKELLRAYGTFPHPNVLGGFLAVALAFILGVSKRRKMFFWATFIIGVMALILTFSRSAWVVAVLAISWQLFRNRRHIFILTTTVAILLIGFTFGFSDESVVIRGQLNAAAIEIFTSSPVFGVGLGNFLVALPDHIPSRTIYFLQPVHNIYLLLLSEVGLVGVITLVWIMRKQIKITAPLIALLLLGLVDHYPATLQQGRLLLTLFIALSYRAPH